MRMDGTAHLQQRVLQTTVDGVKSELGDDPCVICLDRISEKALAFPCKHESFDFICLISWLQEKSTCPLCKATVKSVQYDLNSSTGSKTFVPTPTISSTKSTTSISYHPRSRPAFSSRRLRHTTTRSSTEPSSEDGGLARRRYVYRNQLRCMHVGTNRISQYQDFIPATLSQNEIFISRARKWIRRELQALDFLGPDSSKTADIASARGERGRRKSSNAEFLLEYIIAVIKTVDLKGSGGQAEELLQEFLGRDNARVFIHELEAWLRSPYESLEDWDRHIQYDDRHLRRATPRHDQRELRRWDSWRPPRRQNMKKPTITRTNRHEYFQQANDAH